MHIFLVIESPAMPTCTTIYFNILYIDTKLLLTSPTGK